MRVLVCGGRSYGNIRRVHAVLEAIHAATPITLLIQGGAQGADLHAREWARNRGVEHLTMAPDWNKHGKAAGPIRNQRMLDEGKPNLVVAFPGSRGTADMCTRALAAGVQLRDER